MGFNESLNDNSNKNNLTLVSNKKVILWLIFFFPYGLYLMWRKTNWNKGIKIGVSALFAVLCVISLVSGSSTDKTEKSSTGITSIEIAHSEDVNLDLSRKLLSSKENYVRISSDNKTFSIDDLEFVSKDPKVATIELKEYKSGDKVYFYILGQSAGETTIYVQTKDGIVKSNEIKVICEGEIPTTTEPTTQETTTEETTTEKETEKSTSSNTATTKKSSSSNNTNKQSSSSKNNNKGSSSKGSGSGSSSGSSSSEKGTYLLNKNSGVFHIPGCPRTSSMKDENKQYIKNTSPKELEKQGYKRCGSCLK